MDGVNGDLGWNENSDLEGNSANDWIVYQKPWGPIYLQAVAAPKHGHEKDSIETIHVEDDGQEETELCWPIQVIDLP